MKFELVWSKQYTPSVSLLDLDDEDDKTMNEMKQCRVCQSVDLRSWMIY